jgi:hypothetical protein
MNRIFLVGTLHAGFTPPKELISVLESLALNQLLVEIVQSDIQKNKLAHYPPEMTAALKWARANRISVSGFDARLSVLRKEKTKADNRKVIGEQSKLIRKYSWRFFNRLSHLKKLETKEYLDLIDLVKFQAREDRMAAYIRKRMNPSGRVAIVTGCAHLPFFKRTFKWASIPLARKR